MVFQVKPRPENGAKESLEESYAPTVIIFCADEGMVKVVSGEGSTKLVEAFRTLLLGSQASQIPYLISMDFSDKVQIPKSIYGVAEVSDIFKSMYIS